MAVQCANCGEELLGAVNRCWRCGQTLTPHDGPSEIPPVRRSPIVGSLTGAAIEAEIINTSTTGTPSSARQPEIRRGSPFASAKRASTSATTTRAGKGIAQTPKPVASYTAPRMAGAVSLPLAAFSLVLAYSFPPGAIAVALAAVGFGIWGLYCPSHKLGTAGVVLGCLALALAAFFGTIELYEYLYGVNPFSAPPPAPIINP